MRTISTRLAARSVAAFVGLAVIAAVPVALGADSTTVPSGATALRAQSSSAAAQAHAAVLTLYALETQLARARTEVAAADARRASVARERESTRRQLRAARKSMRASEQQLGALVRALYEQSGTDPLAIVLGAGSLDEALTGLDNLSRAAGENRRVLEHTRAARRRLARLDGRLARREAELRRVSDAAQTRAQTLEAKSVERSAFIASLRRLQGLNDRKVAALESQARAAERKSATLDPVAATAAPSAARPAPVAVAQPPAAPASGRTLTVTALGYSLPGRTASGLPVGHGIVAVDPSVIPLGTRLYVPGYGEAVAADTGGDINGTIIDLWFPTTAAALQWGRRTVTITLR